MLVSLYLCIHTLCLSLSYRSHFSWDKIIVVDSIWVPPFFAYQPSQALCVFALVCVCMQRRILCANLMLSFIVWRKIKISTEEFYFFIFFRWKLQKRTLTTCAVHWTAMARKPLRLPNLFTFNLILICSQQNIKGTHACMFYFFILFDLA